MVSSKRAVKTAESNKNAETTVADKRKKDAKQILYITRI